MIRVFCDMDEVLVQWPHRVDGHEKHTRFDLKVWLPRGREIWGAAVARAPGHRVTLISKVRDVRLALGYHEKRQWVDVHLGREVPLIVTPDSLGKAPYCIPGDLLVDDDEKNCVAWRKAGGRAIHHKTVDETLKAIREFPVDG